MKVIPPSEFFDETLNYLVGEYGEFMGQQYFDAGAGISNVTRRVEFYKALIPDLQQRQLVRIGTRIRYKSRPVKIRTFVENEYYLGLKGQVFPAVMEAMEEMNSGKYVEAVLTGAIGTAKTTLALWSTAYQLYLLSLIKDPQREFNLDRTSEIVFIFQSITADLVKKLDYARFRELIKKSQYFKDHFPYREDLESEMQFPNRVIVRPVSGQDTAAIGQNVFGGVIDELNYMSVVENSKNSFDGGTYDQAVAVYNSIARRRKSRFLKQGALPGLLCLVSSRRYPGQFTDIKEEEAKTDPTIFVYDKVVWDIKPDAFSGQRFNLFIGDEGRKPRILSADEPVLEKEFELVMQIPEEYRHEFETDIYNALREIAGVSTLASHPYITDSEAVSDAMSYSRPSVFSEDFTDFDLYPIKVLPKAFGDLEHFRFAHVDLGLSSDSAGVAIGYVDKFLPISRGDVVEMMPHIVIDGVLEVRPPKNGEIKFWRIRELFYKLRELGLPIKWVTYDSYQSVDSLQILRSKGFVTGNQSMDMNRRPYDTLKSALYDRRLEIPEHPHLRRELVSLEDDVKKGKVDHPPHSSKDCSDALAGVVYGLTIRREIWAQHGVPVASIPLHLLQKPTEEG